MLRLLGGLHYGWVMVGLTFGTVLLSTGIRTAPPVLITPLEAEFGWDRASLSLAISLYMLLQAATTPIQGQLIDNYGPRRVLIVSLLVVSAGILAMPWVTEAWQFVALWGGLVGVGTGGATGVLGSIVAARWFTANRGFVIGVLSNASSAGQLLFFPLLMAISLAAGWRAAVYTLAGLVLLVLLPLIVLLYRDAPKGETWARGAPRSRTAAATSADGEGVSLRQALRTRDFWLLTVSYFICGSTDAGLTGTHLVPYAVEGGVPEMAAAGIIGVMGVANVPGSLISGWLSDRFDPRWVLAAIFGSRVVALALLPALTGSGGLFVFAVLFGFGWIAQRAPMTQIVTNLYGQRSMGGILGWISPGHQLGAAGMAYLAGAIHTWTGGYDLAFQLGTALTLIATLAVLALRKEPVARVPAMNVSAR
jgi:MFS family permease